MQKPLIILAATFIASAIFCMARSDDEPSSPAPVQKTASSTRLANDLSLTSKKIETPPSATATSAFARYSRGAGKSSEPLSLGTEDKITTSSDNEDSNARGAIDLDRFESQLQHSWQGKASEKSWWWQIDFAKPRTIGAILQTVGDHSFAMHNGPKDYVWQFSTDGRNWQELPETKIKDERRTFRIHRFKSAKEVVGLRLKIDSATGEFPTLREVEFFAESQATVSFEPWAVVLSTTGDKHVPGEGKQFVPLMKTCAPMTEAQNVWLGDFDESFLAIEPTPLCVFMSGNFIDWCQQNREHWRGVQEVLTNKNVPIWASCGGMQGLAIISEVGVDHEWDCPHCRDPKNPKLPIYTRIPGSIQFECGKYKECVFERGAFKIRKLFDDPVFAGLPNEFEIMESHCGQIEWTPKGWTLIATKGEGSLTKTQTLRLKDRYIYASQYHIEMKGTAETSQLIMKNFLELAAEWGGYNPSGKPISTPKSLQANN